MPTLTIIDTDYATLWYHPESKVVHHQFHKFIYGENFRDVLNKGIEVFTENDAHKWLSDDRNNSSLTAEDRDWSLNDWFPRAYDAGWKYWAIIMPDKVAGQLTMNNLMKRYIAPFLTVQVFDDPDHALKWLESVE